jgi:peptide/nickel transport system permease protein
LAILAAVLAPWVAPSDPYQVDTTTILQSPSRSNWLGTDELGRDILSRLVYGARISISVAFGAVSIAVAIGVPLGIAAALMSNTAKNLIMRTVDMFVAIPEIFVAVVVLAFVGAGFWTLTLTIGVLYFPQFARVTYSSAVSIRSRDFVLAATTLGASKWRLAVSEILPNLRSIVIAQVAFTLSFAMLLEAGLSFLGLGIAPPVPSWGQMIGSLSNSIFLNPWPVVFPSVALFIVIYSLNVLGDYIRVRFDKE